jgi:dTDP-4-dehydrorhamnose reductase
MATLAITGAGGVLGTKLVERALAQGETSIHAYSHHTLPASSTLQAAGGGRVVWTTLDLGNGQAVADALAQSRPDVVINAAAMTNVDACERNRDEALAANALGPRYLAEACVRLGAQLIHVSTDYVFPGDDQQPGPYSESAPVRPINYYGSTKLEGEQGIIQTCADQVRWLVARTALVYGQVPGGRANFVSWLVGELRSGKQVKIVSDQYNTPTLADDLASALLHLMRASSEGIIHVAGPDLLSRVEWARAIASYYGLEAGLIEVVTSAELKQPAQRPLRSGLHTERQAELEGVELRGAQAGLAALALNTG